MLSILQGHSFLVGHVSTKGFERFSRTSPASSIWLALEHFDIMALALPAKIEDTDNQNNGVKNLQHKNGHLL